MTKKGQRFLDFVAQVGELDVTVLASSKFPDDMRYRKPSPQKVYEYSTNPEAGFAWVAISYPIDYDEFDVAEEVAQILWDQGDGDTHDEFEHGTVIHVREKGSDKVTQFKIEVDYEPQFYIKPVTA